MGLAGAECKGGSVRGRGIIIDRASSEWCWARLALQLLAYLIVGVGAESTVTIEWSARLRRGSVKAVWIGVQGDARYEGKAG